MGERARGWGLGRVFFVAWAVIVGVAVILGVLYGPSSPRNRWGQQFHEDYQMTVAIIFGYATFDIPVSLSMARCVAEGMEKQFREDEMKDKARAKEIGDAEGKLGIKCGCERGLPVMVQNGMCK